MSKSILIVEDEALIAMNLEMDVEDAGYEVGKICMTLSGMLDTLKDGSFDGAILDVDLRGETVFAGAKVLQEKGIPFVFHTGHGDKEKIESRFPGSTVFRKPTDADVLLKTLFG